MTQNDNIFADLLDDLQENEESETPAAGLEPCQIQRITEAGYRAMQAAARGEDASAIFYAELRTQLSAANGSYVGPDPLVQSQLQVKAATGAVVPSLENGLTILSQDARWADKFWYNERSESLMCGDRPLEDADVTGFRLFCSKAYHVTYNKDSAWDLIQLHASSCRRDLVREWFGSLPAWDGVSRLQTATLTALKSSSDPRFLQVWMRSAVARVFEPGCKADAMLVLEGEQGAGKSRVLNALCADSSWCIEGLMPSSDKDSLLNIRKGFIVLLDELDAATRKRDVSELKNFLSTTEDTFRPPYGRASITSKRRCVFAGGVNSSGQGFLKDTTGNRRFLFVEVQGEVDVDWVKENREQLWAEALWQYRQGMPTWLPAADINVAAAKFVDTDPMLEVVGPYLDSLPTDAVTSAREVAAACGLTKDFDKTSKRMGVLLRQCGWVPSGKQHAITLSDGWGSNASYRVASWTRK